MYEKLKRVNLLVQLDVFNFYLIIFFLHNFYA